MTQFAEQVFSAEVAWKLSSNLSSKLLVNLTNVLNLLIFIILFNMG